MAQRREKDFLLEGLAVFDLGPHDSLPGVGNLGIDAWNADNQDGTRLDDAVVIDGTSLDAAVEGNA